MPVMSQPEPAEEALPIESDPLEVATRRLVSDLHTPRPVWFWTDLVASAGIGWTAFALTARAPLFSASMLVASAISALALYRGLCFTHELTHLRRRALPGFETTWNLLFGVPLLLPSFTYIGVHQSHHSLSTYGTKDDPEYLPFANSRRLMIIFGIQSSVLLPILIALRFLLLAPIGLIWPRVHRWLEAYASSFAMNPKFVRSVSPATAQKMRRWEWTILAAWALPIVWTLTGRLPYRAWLLWLLVLTFISFLNTLRVLGAHEYETDGRPRSREGQLHDSIDTPGGPWTELWAPVGLRYHALHHYFPGIPYHNLGAAYRRLVHGLPRESTYRESTSPGLWHSLKGLYRNAKRRGAAFVDLW